MSFTFVFQLHNRVNSIKQMLDPFIDNLNDNQILIFDDMSNDGTSAVLDSYLPRLGFDSCIIRTPDVYETEITNKAFRLANREFVVLMQDDDYYPNLNFCKEAYRIFEKYSFIAALSCKHGVMLDKNMNIRNVYGWYPDSGSNSIPVLSDNLQLVDVVDRAPMIVRKSAYELIGGIDNNLLLGGYNDWDMCIRWRLLKPSYRVGIFRWEEYGFRHWTAGCRLPNSKAETKLAENRIKVYNKHKHVFGEIFK